MNYSCSNNILVSIIVSVLLMLFLYKKSNIKLKEEFSFFTKIFSPIPPINISSTVHNSITDIIKNTTQSSISNQSTSDSATTVLSNSLDIYNSCPTIQPPDGKSMFSFEVDQSNKSEMKVSAIQNMKMDTTVMSKMADDVADKVHDHIKQAKSGGLLDDGINISNIKTNIRKNIHESLQQNTEHNMSQKLSADTSEANKVKVDRCGAFCSDALRLHAIDKGEPDPCKNKISQENLAKTAASQTAGQVLKSVVKGNQELKVLTDTSSKVDQSSKMGAGGALLCCCCCCCCCCLLIPIIGFAVSKMATGSDGDDMTSDV